VLIVLKILRHTRPLTHSTRLWSQILCIGLAIWVLVELSFEDSKKKDDEKDDKKGSWFGR
jgi:hypothetical protein